MNRVPWMKFVGGWKVAMTTLVYTGFPVNITATNNSLTNNNSQPRQFTYKQTQRHRSHRAGMVRNRPIGYRYVRRWRQ